MKKKPVCCSKEKNSKKMKSPKEILNILKRKNPQEEEFLKILYVTAKTKLKVMDIMKKLNSLH